MLIYESHRKRRMLNRSGRAAITLIVIACAVLIAGYLLFTRRHNDDAGDQVDG